MAEPGETYEEASRLPWPEMPPAKQQSYSTTSQTGYVCSV